MSKLLLLLSRRLQKFLQLTDGRDKSIKVAQYTLQLLLLYYWTHPTPRRQTYVDVAKTFSMTRKLLRLAHVVEPCEPLLQRKWTWIAVIETLNDIIDDLICLSKLKLLPNWLESTLDPWSSRLWCLSIMNDLRDPKLASVKRIKLISDFIFALNDIVPNPRTKEMQAWTGMTSGCLSTYLLWKKIKAAVPDE